MGTSNYSDELKRDAVHQITVRGYPVREVSRRLGVGPHPLYKWIKLFSEPAYKAPGVDHEAENRVARLAGLAGIAAQIDYKRGPGRNGGKPAVTVSNGLDRQFGVDAPDMVWVTDITYIKTHEGWLYLAVVIDLFSRRVVGGFAQPRMTTDLALQALLASVWRRKPKAWVMIHSDQGSQFTSREWQLLINQHNLDASMSRRGNCYDNAIAESFFQLLKRERIRRRTYLTREAARQDGFDYIEMFYNPKRKHTNNGMLSPVDFKIRQQKLNEASV